jgi:transcriptional regulator with XRE-family HTH domain
VLGNIIAIRHNRKLSQKQLADQCEVTQQFIQQIEKGTKNPSVKVLQKIASALEVSLDELVNSKKVG